MGIYRDSYMNEFQHIGIFGKHFGSKVQSNSKYATEDQA